jgi:hypothetical protein
MRSGRTAGSVSASTSDMSFSVCSSMPFVATTSSVSAPRSRPRLAATERRCCDGGTRITTSAPATTGAVSAKAWMVGGSSMPAR